MVVRKDAKIAMLLGGRQAYDQLLNTCLSLNLGGDKKGLESLTHGFSHISVQLHNKVDEFKSEISKMPVIALILFWAELIRQDKVFGDRYLNMMQKLVETGLLFCGADKKKTFTLKDLSLQEPSHIIDEIRSFQNWPLDKREDYVLLYKNFSSWLSKETFGYIPEAKDLDREATLRRRIPFESYIEILRHLDLREQILAKMFYLGGHRALEEVLSLKIEDIDFAGKSILFIDEAVSYPSHVFQDLKAYIQDRKKGHVFMGREGERISHTTPFRSLKTVVFELGLDPTFTFKEFIKNR